MALTRAVCDSALPQRYGRSIIITQKTMTLPTIHRRIARNARRLQMALALAAAALATSAASAAAAPAAGAYSEGEVVVRYAASPGAASAAAANTGVAQTTRLVHTPRGVSVSRELTMLRAQAGVLWAVPDYVAHASGAAPFYPDDRGAGKLAGEWQKLQWDFVGPFGIEAPEAWGNVAADGAPGGKNVIVAVLDTGVAYANRGPFRRSPDFSAGEFVHGYDFVDHNHYPNDRNGHGTFVAAEIAEETNNGYGLTGLAYEAKIMPVRVLDSAGEGEASTIAEGVIFAAKHGAQVINLSLEFSPGVTAADIPELIEAIRYAHRRGVLIVAAAGNEGHEAIAYPARAPDVVSVGASTEHGCLASYSNYGSTLSLVAPGGGPDASLPGDPNCRPEATPGQDIYQVTFTGSSPSVFGIPSGYEGTSMATPQVAATAALVIASGVIGHHPTPAQLTARLMATTRKLGYPGDEHLYGAGLLDAAAATASGGPGAIVSKAASRGVPASSRA
jgi:serine protease